MRIMIIFTATILVIGASLAGNTTPLTDRCPKTTPEARGLRPVECPASWPRGKGAGLKSAKFWDFDFSPGAPLCGAGKKEEIDITGLMGPSDLGCTYSNGARLLISVPGTPFECWSADRRQLNTGHFNDGLVCYFKPTGDQAKDEIKITELEKLTRDFELFGLRLGMTRAEAEQALNAQGAQTKASEGPELHATATDGKAITILLAHEDKIRAIDVETTGTRDDPYFPLKHRFGVPETDWDASKSHASGFWTGEPHIRLEISPLHITTSSPWRLRLIDQNAEQ
ncbi:MAG TPA: hypothetical protein VLZ74_00955 [Methylocella sp.]|nr:hypothetical protein [Methylocella sp.]